METWEEDLQKLLETLNCCHPTIKFTAEYFRAKLDFLDVTAMKNEINLLLFVCKTD